MLPEEWLESAKNQCDSKEEFNRIFTEVVTACLRTATGESIKVSLVKNILENVLSQKNI